MLRAHVKFLREKLFQSWGRHIFQGFIVVAIIAVVVSLAHAALFGPPGTDPARSEFVVTPDDTLDDVVAKLQEGGYAKYGYAVRFAYVVGRGESSIRPGGYEVARDMDAWTIAKVLGRAPYLAWVTIPNGVRKEQIADILVSDLGWTEAQRRQWLEIDTAVSDDVREGVYFPDTYLIPSDQPPAAVAARLRGRFEEVFAPYAELAAKKKIPWTDVVNLAALVERESAKNDKALVAGILWNRLNKDMLLQVDATLQYLAGTQTNWWPAPDPDDKYASSTFNTYKHLGLPPHPIANPSLDSIAAVLSPQKTACLYYLHDRRGRIHCSTTYKAHLSNVNIYLR